MVECGVCLAWMIGAPRNTAWASACTVEEQEDLEDLELRLLICHLCFWMLELSIWACLYLPFPGSCLPLTGCMHFTFALFLSWFSSWFSSWYRLIATDCTSCYRASCCSVYVVGLWQSIKAYIPIYKLIRHTGKTVFLQFFFLRVHLIFGTR